MLEFNATFFLVILSFIIFMLLMKSLYFDPVGKIKQVRIRKIEDDQQMAATYLSDYDQLRQDYEAGLSSARKQAQKVIQDIRLQAKQSAGEMLAQAKGEANRNLEKEIEALHSWQELVHRELGAEKSELIRVIIRKVTADTALIIS